MPPDVVAGIDQAVGVRQRSAFLTELARRELLRREQQLALEGAAGTWKDKDHPELARGGAAYVARMRRQGETRFQKLLERNSR